MFHEKNKGKGAALRTGFKYTAGEVIIIQDADLEYDPQDYIKLMEPINSGIAEVVYGSRFLERRYTPDYKFFFYFILLGIKFSVF